FEKILVINLRSRTDRRDAISLAAATSNLKIEFIDGVNADSIPEYAFPPGKSRLMSKGIKGSWRSHMNALQTIVNENLTSALILEDDADWDVRLHPQLQTFALASRCLLQSAEASSLASSHYPIEQIPNPEDPERSIHNDTSRHPILPILQSLPLSSPLCTHHHHHPTSSPYGDPTKWDVLWLGHCGAGFPRSPSSSPALLHSPQNLLLTHSDDATVPAPRFLRAHPFGPLDALSASHPPHT
ncbi:glycosyltransferase family 25 protein, partial [Glonium stellatum]